MNPTGEKWMDGHTLSQYEIMFVKVKDHLKFSTNSLTLNAIKTSDWMDGLVSLPQIFEISFERGPGVYDAWLNMNEHLYRFQLRPSPACVC